MILYIYIYIYDFGQSDYALTLIPNQWGYSLVPKLISSGPSRAYRVFKPS